MNTQDILARVNDAMQPFQAIEKARDSRGYNAESVARAMHVALSALADDLAAQVRMECAAKSGSLDAVKSVNRMMADAAKNRRSLGYAWIDEQGRQCACDGYRAYRLSKHLPLEARPDDAGEPIDLGKIFHAPISDPALALELPTVGELKAHIALKRAEWMGKKKDFACHWDFGEGKPAVNAAFLLDALAVLGDGAKAFADTLTGKMNALATVWITSERGEGLLLPLRLVEKQAQQSQADAERQAAEEQAREAERRRIYHAHALDEMLRMYKEHVARDPEYAMDPQQFAALSEHVEQHAA